ncbi:uncharacterized protein LOC107858455 isoform X2 [Capsicum annuum]|uniref:uncharacterized protein LOC107858455 isoform X2 n=1 Tax=Capsicum annuum TaxID=4072 RepID=UPI001FB055BB|nr:uncharacterized protein LOC107858455 isoform X2 [Capsicum annuum]
MGKSMAALRLCQVYVRKESNCLSLADFTGSVIYDLVTAGSENHLVLVYLRNKVCRRCRWLWITLFSWQWESTFMSTTHISSSK